jgi:hypothetical protein
LTTVVIHVPTAHNELYYDASTEPIATCACGQYAITVCGHCRQYRCPGCQPAGEQICTACAGSREVVEARTDRDRQLAAVAQVLDPVERLVRTATVLEHDPGDDVYAWVSRVCPYVPYSPWMRFWEPLEAVLPPGPQPLPWDSAAIGGWFAARAAGFGIIPGFQIVEGRVFQERSYGWRLIAGSNVRLADGFTDTAFVLTSGLVVRATAPEEHHPGVISTRRTEPTGLNLLALAELGKLLGLHAPAS